jgi:hypothetical protein
MAIYPLAQICGSEPEAIEAFKSAFRDKDRELRISVIRVCGLLRSKGPAAEEAAMVILKEGLFDSNTNINLESVRVLWLLGSAAESALPLLQELQDNPEKKEDKVLQTDLQAAIDAIKRSIEEKKKSTPGSPGAPGLQGTLGSDGSAAQVETRPGGVDFRALPVIPQPAPLGTVALGGPERSLAEAIPVSELDTEWRQIRNMIEGGIIPSTYRIKEYLEASCGSECLGDEMDKVLICIADILRLEEGRVSSTESALRELLVFVESMGGV